MKNTVQTSSLNEVRDQYKKMAIQNSDNANTMDDIDEFNQNKLFTPRILKEPKFLSSCCSPRVQSSYKERFFKSFGFGSDTFSRDFDQGSRNHEKSSTDVLSPDSIITSETTYTITSKISPHDSASVNASYLKRLRQMNDTELINYISSQIVGRNLFIKTPFGDKLKLYVDYTASGQQLYFISDIISKIEELYANTHTDTSYTGAYMNYLLNSAEDMIMKECNASRDEYFIVDSGSGSTFAIEMTQKIIGTYIPPQTKENLKGCFDSDVCFEAMKDKLRKKNQLPLVITTHYEHHSNEITWRKQLCDVIETPFRMDGFVDMEALEEILEENKNRKIIGSLSAGSNVTGIKTDVVGIATLLKKYGALCFFDYGGVGPYVKIDLSLKTQDGRNLIDGIYVSPHKFLGGPGSCGLLIMNKKCYNNKLAPTHGGGGTVDYVGRQMETFTEDPNHREKSGTPGIIQIIKAGLAFELKGILQHIIDKREVYYNAIFFDRVSKLRPFMLLGPKDEHAKVTIMSFNIWHNGPKGMRWLHPQLVIRLLNDIFGIQGRAGCSCAGPYGHYLLNIDDETSAKFKFWIDKHPELGDDIQILGIKPGWARINLHYSMRDFEIDYLLFALEYLCEHGEKFLPVYTFEASTGMWNHIKHRVNFPKFGLEYMLEEERMYAKNEEGRKGIFEKQKKEALDLLKTLPRSAGYDSIPEMEKLCTFYVEKGNIKDRELIEKKAKFYRPKK